jgi:hypothetical protein
VLATSGPFELFDTYPFTCEAKVPVVPPLTLTNEIGTDVGKLNPGPAYICCIWAILQESCTKNWMSTKSFLSHNRTTKHCHWQEDEVFSEDHEDDVMINNGHWWQVQMVTHFTICNRTDASWLKNWNRTRAPYVELMMEDAIWKSLNASKAFNRLNKSCTVFHVGSAVLQSWHYSWLVW